MFILFDFIFSFQSVNAFWIFYFSLFGIFTLINWSLFDYLLSENFITSRSIQRKGFFLIFIISLIVSKLLSASLRTGLVQKSDYLTESFEDVIKNNKIYRNELEANWMLYQLQVHITSQLSHNYKLCDIEIECLTGSERPFSC